MQSILKNKNMSLLQSKACINFIIMEIKVLMTTGGDALIEHCKLY